MYDVKRVDVMAEKKINYRSYFGIVFREVKRKYTVWVSSEKNMTKQNTLEKEMQEKLDKMARINQLFGKAGTFRESEETGSASGGVNRRNGATGSPAPAPEPVRETIGQVVEFLGPSGKRHKSCDVIKEYRRKLAAILGSWEGCRDLYWILAVFEAGSVMQTEVNHAERPDYAQMLKTCLQLFDDTSVPLSKAERAAYRLDVAFMLANWMSGALRGNAGDYDSLARELDRFWTRDWAAAKSGASPRFGTVSPQLQAYVQENSAWLNDRGYLRAALRAAGSQADKKNT